MPPSKLPKELKLVISDLIHKEKGIRYVNERIKLAKHLANIQAAISELRDQIQQTEGERKAAEEVLKRLKDAKNGILDGLLKSQGKVMKDYKSWNPTEKEEFRKLVESEALDLAKVHIQSQKNYLDTLDKEIAGIKASMAPFEQSIKQVEDLDKALKSSITAAKVADEPI